MSDTEKMLRKFNKQSSLLKREPLSYREYVRLGKEMLSTVRCYQVQIAFYATQVCTINHGGPVGRQLYTLTDYANDIGVNRKTLSQWTLVYRCVIEKLDIDLNDVTVHDWDVATKVLNHLKSEKQAINEAIGTIKAKDKGWKINTPKAKIRGMFNRFQKGRPVEAEVHSWTDAVIGIKNKLNNKDLSRASTDSLMLLKKNLDKASENITNYLIDDRSVPMEQLI